MDTGLPDARLKRLARNCKRAREDSGLSAEDVAARIDKSSGYIYQLERATLNPPLAVLVQLKKIYRTTPQKLLQGVF